MKSRFMQLLSMADVLANSCSGSQVGWYRVRFASDLLIPQVALPPPDSEEADRTIRAIVARNRETLVKLGLGMNTESDLSNLYRAVVMPGAWRAYRDWFRVAPANQAGLESDSGGLDRGGVNFDGRSALRNVAEIDLMPCDKASVWRQDVELELKLPPGVADTSWCLARYVSSILLSIFNNPAAMAAKLGEVSFGALLAFHFCTWGKIVESSAAFSDSWAQKNGFKDTWGALNFMLNEGNKGYSYNFSSPHLWDKNLPVNLVPDARLEPWFKHDRTQWPVFWLLSFVFWILAYASPTSCKAGWW